jgi:hypothetical protein
MLQQENAEATKGLAHNDEARHWRAKGRAAAFQEVLSLLDAEAAAQCDHEWVMKMIQMPEGQEKPGGTTCRKCGAVDADVVLSGTSDVTLVTEATGPAEAPELNASSDPVKK